MRRAASLGLVLALLGLAAIGATPATATIVSPAPGGGMSMTGSFLLAFQIVRSTCPMRLSGQVASTTTVSLTGGGGQALGCTTGTLTLGAMPWRLQVTLPGAFVMDFHMTFDAVVPMFGTVTCIWAGQLSGTHTSGASTRFTVTGDTLVRQAGSSSICSTDPSVSTTWTSTVTTT